MAVPPALDALRQVNLDLVIDALGGAVTFRPLQGHAPLTKKFTDALVRLVLSGCRNASPSKEPR